MAKRKQSNDDASSSNGWRELTTSAAAWNPDDEDGDNKGGPIVGLVERSKRVRTKFGERDAVYVRLTEPGAVDTDGVVHEAGDVLLVWCSARLRDLPGLEGTEVRITPSGFDSKNKRGQRTRIYKLEARTS